MEGLEQAGQMVLVSYGQFLENISVRFHSLKKSFELQHGELLNPLGIQITDREHCSIFEKLDTDSKIYNKVLTVFTAVCREVYLLHKELKTDFIPKILNYAKGASENTNSDEEQIQICDFLPALLDILNFVHRCRTVFQHLLLQFVCAYDYQWLNAQNSSNLQLLEVYSTLGNLLLIFVSLDVTLMYDDNQIVDHIQMLEQTIKTSADTNPEDDSPQLATLKKVITEVKRELLKGNIFMDSLRIESDKKILLSNCSAFKVNFNSYLKNLVSEIENSRENSLNAMYSLSKAVTLFVFGANIFGIIDKKLYKSISELCKKYVVVPLHGDILWLPNSFIVKHLEIKLKEQGIKSTAQENLTKSLELAELNLSKNLKTYSLQILRWTLSMENILSTDSINSPLNDIESALLCLEGIDTAFQIKFQLNLISYLHSMLGVPMTKMVALNLCKLIELMQFVQTIFQRHQIGVGKRSNHVIQRLLIQILSLIIKSENETIRNKSTRNVEIDSYSALALAEKLLYGACTEESLLLVRLVLTFTSPSNSLFSEVLGTILKLLEKLRTFCRLKDNIRESTTCNFISSESHILPIYFKHIMEGQLSLSRVQYILNSSDEEKASCDQLSLLFSQQKEHFENIVVLPLCQEIEVFLRIHAHSHLQSGSATFPLNKEFKSLLRVMPLSVSGHVTSIKSLIESYLDRTFYDLATVALHDWQTYREMRSIAEHKFKLNTVEDNLPSQTLAQSLDVLQIMRNIHVFVCKYVYNLNTQCFIESNSNSKHLNTIQITQIANSIWTHGTGVMNTTTNFIYQFLRKKFVVFSQFLYDESISSRLIKDLNFFNELKLQKNSYYPYDRANKFNKGISRLGVSSDGLTFLDQYRSLITQIGNALGYVRMVRTGGLHHCLQAASYLPEIDYISLSKENLGDTGKSLMESFDQIIFNIIHNLSENTDHLKLLVDVFANVFNTPENSHLQLFSMIIPPLTINYVDYIVTAKEKMTKKNKDGTVFTDDGFAMGIAYLLAVLNLNIKFDSLHWFESVNRKYESEENAILQSAEYQKLVSSPQENTHKLSIRRLQMYKREFQFLYYNINSARVFFNRK